MKNESRGEDGANQAEPHSREGSAVSGADSGRGNAEGGRS